MKTMRRTFAAFLLAAALACSASAQPVVTMVVNRTSYSAFVSPGSWVIILGYNFAPSPLSAQAGSLPTTLGGTSVTVGGLPASLLSVSPTEIDALIPSQPGNVAGTGVENPGGPTPMVDTAPSKGPFRQNSQAAQANQLPPAPLTGA